MTAIADLREGQTRLTGRVDALQASVDEQRLRIQKVMVDREADVAREAVVARATAGAFQDLINESTAGRGGKRCGQERSGLF